MNVLLTDTIHFYGENIPQAFISIETDKSVLESILCSLKQKKYVALQTSFDLNIDIVEIEKRRVIRNKKGLFLAPRSFKLVRDLVNKSNSVDLFLKKIN